MAEDKIVVAGEDELPPPLATSKVQVAGDEELPPPPKKKYGSHTISIGFWYFKINGRSCGIRNPFFFRD